MIRVKTPREIEKMRRAGTIAAAARALAGKLAVPGATTQEIDKEVEAFIRSQHAIPTCIGYCGYPAATCISVNEVVVHGIPGKRVIKDGDLVSIDLDVGFEGYIGDCAATFIAGKARCDEDVKLLSITRQAFYEGLKFARPGYRVSDISAAVQQFVEANGFSVIRDYVGHGIGAGMHEEPEVPNFGRPGHGARLVRGMTICIEPMVAAGDWPVRVLKDGWTAVTCDGSRAAHYENTVLITDGDPEILTIPEPEV